MSTDNAYLGSATRRRLLTATPGSLLWALAGGLGTGAQIATAQPLQAGAVPEVDRLAVRVVTDSYHHAFEASRTVGDVQLQRVGNALKPNAQPRTLLNEWGLSLHLQSSRGEEQRQVLIDFGFNPVTLNNNLDILGVDPAQLDALVLSHGHYDHFGGMVGFLNAHGAKLRKGTALLPRRRGMLLHPRGWRRPGRGQLRLAGPPGYPRRGHHGEVRGEAQRGRRPRLHHRPHRARELRARAFAHPNDSGREGRNRLRAGGPSRGEARRHGLHPGRLRP